MRHHREAVATLLAVRARASFLQHAAEDAHAALAGTEIGPVLEVGEVNHDNAEREALAACYAALGMAQPTSDQLLPCDKPVLPGDRAWSEARGGAAPPALDNGVSCNEPHEA